MAMNLDEILPMAPPPPDRAEPWLIEGYLPAKALVTVEAGEGAAAVTTLLLLSQAAHMAAGASWAGCPARQPMRVAYFDLAFRHGIGSVVRAIEKYDSIDVAGRLKFVRGALSIAAKGSTLRLVDSLRQDPPNVLYVNPLAFALNGVRIDNDRVAEALRYVRQELGCTVVAVVPEHVTGSLTSQAAAHFGVARSGRRIWFTPERTSADQLPAPVEFELTRTTFGIVPVATPLKKES